MELCNGEAVVRSAGGVRQISGFQAAASLKSRCGAHIHEALREERDVLTGQGQAVVLRGDGIEVALPELLQPPAGLDATKGEDRPFQLQPPA